MAQFACDHTRSEQLQPNMILAPFFFFLLLRIRVLIAPKVVHPPVRVDRMRRKVCAISIYVPAPSERIKQCLLHVVDVGELQVKPDVAVAYLVYGITRVPQHLHAAFKKSVLTNTQHAAVLVFPRDERNLSAFAPVNRHPPEEFAPQGVAFHALEPD